MGKVEINMDYENQKRVGVNYNKDTILGTPSNPSEPAAIQQTIKEKASRKWTVCIKPSLKRALKVYAAKNDKRDHMVLEEAIREFLENRK